MMKSSKFLTTLSLTIVLTVSGVNIIPFTSASFNDSKAEAAITIRNDYVWMDMPQTGNQNDNWSCGPTSAARVMNFYGHNLNRSSLVNAINKDFVIPPSFKVPAPTLKNPFGTRRVDIRTGTTPHALRDVMKRWEGDNVKLERKADFNKLLGLLRQGKPVVVLLRVEPSINVAGTTWPAMHWVVVNGFSDKHIYFTETNDGKIYQYSYGDFQSKWDWRVGKGLASEALHKNGVQPKTMIWVDRVPPVVAQSQGTPSQQSDQPTSLFSDVNRFDAGVLHPNGKAYFFAGDKYYRFDFQSDQLDKIGRIGVDGWKGLPANIGAAMIHPNGKAYFFAGDQYYRFNFQSDQVDKVGRIGVDGWRGLPTNIDLAVEHPNGKAYFFRLVRYYRYDFQIDQVDKDGRIGADGWKGLIRWEGGNG
ncbi:MAG: hemopexin repeat-containing protein [Dolichospermum sp.]